jgi:hypothetical protein
MTTATATTSNKNQNIASDNQVFPKINFFIVKTREKLMSF